MKRYGILPEFTKEMQRVFPEVYEIDTIPYPDGTQGPVYVIVPDGQRIPIYTFGDGMRRWFRLLGHMLVNQNALHCIEEIDATFSPYYLLVFAFVTYGLYLKDRSVFGYRLVETLF